LLLHPKPAYPSQSYEPVARLTGTGFFVSDAQTDSSAYEYQPEQPLPKDEYEKIANQLKFQDTAVTEDTGFEHVVAVQAAVRLISTNKEVLQ
jgi:hypothetical protein